MFHTEVMQNTNKKALYAELLDQTRGLLSGEHDLIANAAQFSALIFNSLTQINWAGFYLFDGTELVVGPFQGKPACVRIPISVGVCGTAAKTRKTQVVHDVNTFDGHIACDVVSQSEIVVPLIYPDGTLLGVWDVDSFIINRFDEDDCFGMESLCTQFMSSLRHP
ncbi:GAF domain-containing protein [Allopusillimonas ginsengisoli]|uniref:GAF domain-containing protein n=1 Tax=Allopusillimonas ginsengisoli TaxID=453575 RepID=UPI0010C20A9D|nr:GAF domain-containing protein [Allopusillimonas ginsengisoli]